MTADEVKQSHSMRSVVESYGLTPNRAGFIACPFHKERTPSCKIYKDSFYCFGCGAHGDIFTFVEKMDGCDFKTAFKTLGGNFEKASDNMMYRAAKQKAAKKTKENRRKRVIRDIDKTNRKIESNKNIIRSLDDPFSEEGAALIEDNVRLERELDILYERLMEMTNND